MVHDDLVVLVVATLAVVGGQDGVGEERLSWRAIGRSDQAVIYDVGELVVDHQFGFLAPDTELRLVGCVREEGVPGHAAPPRQLGQAGIPDGFDRGGRCSGVVSDECQQLREGLCRARGGGSVRAQSCALDANARGFDRMRR